MRLNVQGAAARTSWLVRGLGAKVRDTFDGIMRTRMVPHHPTNELLVETTQPDRHIILERNAALRREPEALKPAGWRTWVCSIPFEDVALLRRTHPELYCNDRATRRSAWQKFLTSSESLKYRVRGKA